jgi:hypothetical protein
MMDAPPLPRRTIAFAITALLYLAMAGLVHETYFSGFDLPWLVHWTVLPLMFWFAIQSKVVLLFASGMAVLIIDSSAAQLSMESAVVPWFRIAGVLVLLSVSSRFQEIRRRLIESWCATEDARNVDRDQVSVKASQAWGPMLWGIAAVAIKLTMAMLVARLLLINQPWTNRATSWLSWSIANRQILWPGPTLIVCILAVGIALREWAWRQKTRLQMSMYLRSQALLSNYPDLRRITQLQRKKQSSESR